MKLFLIISMTTASIFISGCVKVSLLPQDSIKNSVKAGQNIYTEAKLKRQGGTKKEYSTQVMLSDFTNKDEAEESCLQSLKDKLNDESQEREPVVMSEKMAILKKEDNTIIECQITGFIWAKKA